MNPEEPFPFWAQVWPAAYALADFISKHGEITRGKQILELGGGIGLPSFTAAKYAKSVIVSDSSAEAVALLQRNIRQWGIQNIEAACIDWNHLPENLLPDLVLMSDVNYAPDQFQALLVLIKKLIHTGCCLLLSTPQRITITPFAEALQPFIHETYLYPVLQIDQTIEIRILILKA